ncbi:ATP-dependent Clp protease ATP-binding subunit ClpB [Dysgonomonas sp. PFB1-18]|uniref:ATP-dependent Clp protease ATP-binding subunit n=1 Tax=unclassified Dysgonomonas TaxID=2630389 RepID=UPI002474BD8D|nr:MULTISPECIES: ATP-dependent Clp protease ATP-binding subunit [unclassified Dysgonomonas]MDH6309475.1 ATP-dependent Clp protease ATP-binding subunit ClpB [Dysgonomonas sp. PF1-14]MDH6340885.1 ATP-dependent Clp protease ATP-binding subunit ClpB [Dysgonomonas sp. PF1-16]MDH6382502.1 ATP-dependent Clp protease ATP-binding subunit ClpB [Dysgonomonas sp. PFB1-18]MDH6399854.1 ATP-dependent Clp protease ATP-binding subunit ClpB [Dysgonomonas sp. PF1-23]
MDFINLNESVKTAVRISQSIAREYYNAQYSAAHLLKALMHKEIGLQGFIQSMDKDIEYFEEWAEMRIDEFPKAGVVADIQPDDKIPLIFEEADNVRLKLGLLEINPICVLAALAKPNVGFSTDQLKSFPLRENEIFDLYVSGKETRSSIGMAGNAFVTSEEDGAMPLVNLLKYCVDKTALALDFKIHNIVSRDKETRMMMEILGRHSKPNVMIIGDSGVGKTALVDGLAYDIVNKNVPSYLEGANIYELDTGALIAGATYKGEIEDRLKNIIKEIRNIDNAILFIDEIHTLLDPKQGNSGAANILKPELSKGDLTVIGATTIDEYRKLIEPDHAFNRRFEVLQINEPDIASAILMMHSVLPRYKDFHNLDISKDAVEECVRLAKRYDKDRRLPDSAIDLMDRTMSATKMVNETAEKDIHYFTTELATIEGAFEKTREEKLEDLRFLFFSMQNRLSPVLLGIITDETDVKEIEDDAKLFAYIDKALDTLREFVKEKITTIEVHEVAAIISSKTGIPIGKVQAQEKERLLNMEDLLRRRVVGQDGALKSLVDAILESRSGLNKVGQPIGSFFLLGPTGTGKTELAKSLAEVLFNDEKAMIRFDMSEFKEEHSAALLYGAPPGYVGYEEGGLLVNKIRQQPYAVVLFDEIEKAHSSVYDIFLQIMDEGKLHDRLGKEGDFSNAIVLFTSNVGSEWLTKQLNEGKTPTTTQLMEVMGQYFRPEFLARLSEIVPFSPINETMLLKIFNIQLKGLTEALNKQGIELVIDDDTRKMLAEKGFTPKYGARQVAGTIRTYLRRPISRLIVGNKLNHGQKLIVGKDEKDELTWDIIKEGKQ